MGRRGKVGAWVLAVLLAASAGVVAYFVCAATAHVRARFVGQSFWVNCLGMLGLALATLVFSFVA